jgi:hypothetical protein
MLGSVKPGAGTPSLGMVEMHPERVDWEAEMVRNPSLKRAHALSKSEKYKKWNSNYDAINWEDELVKNLSLAEALGGFKVTQNIAPNLGSNCTYSNCQFTFQIVSGGASDWKEKAIEAQNKEARTEEGAKKLGA